MVQPGRRGPGRAGVGHLLTARLAARTIQSTCSPGPQTAVARCLPALTEKQIITNIRHWRMIHSNFPAIFSIRFTSVSIVSTQLTPHTLYLLCFPVLSTYEQSQAGISVTIAVNIYNVCVVNNYLYATLCVV